MAHSCLSLQLKTFGKSRFDMNKSSRILFLYVCAKQAYSSVKKQADSAPNSAFQTAEFGGYWTSGTSVNSKMRDYLM